jgi:hypothetical protein
LLPGMPYGSISDMQLRIAYRCLALSALLSSAVVAQVTVIEETITTDSVDLFATPVADSAAKSSAIAMMGNLLVPGLGHQYLNRPGRALTYFTLDLACLFGAVMCERYSRRLMDDSRTMAWFYAGARGGPGADQEYWQTVGSYLDSDGYNHVQELNRTPENKYVESNLQWAWVDTSYQKEYTRTRDDATSFHIASGFMVGAMVLNRVVAFIDARVVTRRNSSSRRLSSIRFAPVVGRDGSAAGMHVSGEF